MIVAMRCQLMDEVAGVGRHLGCGGNAMPSHSTGRTAAGKGRTSTLADWTGTRRALPRLNLQLNSLVIEMSMATVGSWQIVQFLD